jgi:hypothetical protein
MDSDSDYETEDETLLHVEVSGLLQEDLRLSSSTPVRFIQVDSAQPLVQVGNQVFIGEFVDTVGTSLLFNQAENTDPVDPVFGRRVSTKVEYLDSTRKKLKLKRVFLKAKQESHPAETSDNTSAATKK